MTPEELAKLREKARIAKDEATDAIEASKAIQAQRWVRLRGVVDDAGDQYQEMRIDSIEESLRDKGAPMWLSVIFDVAIAFIPITALSGVFLKGLSGATQKVLRRGDRKIISKFEHVLERELDDNLLLHAVAQTRKARKAIKDGEEAALRFAKRQDPEVSNLFQNYATEVGKTMAGFPFKRDEEQRKSTAGADAPLVVVKRGLNDWIDNRVRLEDRARELLRSKLTSLVAIAGSDTPEEEAEKRDKEAAARWRRLEPRVPYQTPIDPLPTTNREALKQLEAERDDLLPDPSELASPPQAAELKELQLLIEASIWATAYDFRVAMRKSKSRIGPPDIETLSLPKELWDKLINRYVDPNEGKTYKDVGPIYRLGTIEDPFLDEEASKEYLKFANHAWTPQVRLSHFFSQVLNPAIRMGNGDLVARVRALSSG